MKRKEAKARKKALLRKDLEMDVSEFIDLLCDLANFKESYLGMPGSRLPKQSAYRANEE
jgi:hypothetical protein